MSFFKDFKADFAQAVNELIPDSEEMTSEYDDDEMVNTFDAAPNAAAPAAAGASVADTVAEEDTMEIAPEDLIDDIDDAPGSVNTPAGSGADVQMSFDFLSNALGATGGEGAAQTAQPAGSGNEASVPAGDINPAQAAGTPEAQVIDFAKNFAEALQTEQPATPSAADALAMQGAVQPSAGETSPVQQTAASPEAIAEQMGIMPGTAPVQPEAVPESAPVPTSMEAVQPNSAAENTAVQPNPTAESAAVQPDSATESTAVQAAAQTEAVPEQALVQEEAGQSESAEENASVTTELPAADEAVNIQNQKEEEAMVKVAEVSESTETLGENDQSTTYITKSTKITGDVETEGSIDIIGSVVGNVACKGKLVIGGNVQGNVRANEVYANAARIEGDVICEGSAKIGVGSVIIGKVEGASAVIAGAVNGDIDVQGPVIVDSTAVIMGNIKSKSVQINNGAVIEGFCSQSYSEIDVKSFFA